MIRIMIATPLEEALVARIASHRPDLEVLHDADLLPPPRYPCDHRGDPTFARDATGERRWADMLAHAEVLFGIPGDSPTGLRDAIGRAPALRWIQATSAGAGEHVRRSQLTNRDLKRVRITTASGVHAAPLAEFALLGALAFTKDLPRLTRDKAARAWPHYPVGLLRGKTALIVGLGAIGTEIARLASAFGMRVQAIRRNPERSPAIDGVEVHAIEALPALAPNADVLILALPRTPDTDRVVGAAVLATLDPSAIVVNVGRGSAIDEDALVEALSRGRLAGAALDVFATEPLPPESPLWELDNVIVSPHTAALTTRENEQIVGLFLQNVDRYLSDTALINLVDTRELY